LKGEDRSANEKPEKFGYTSMGLGMADSGFGKLVHLATRIHYLAARIMTIFLAKEIALRFLRVCFLRFDCT